MTNYSIYGDEELCRMAAEDPKAEEYLLVKYKELVRLLARNYFLPWGEWDDLLQEGMIGLLQAIRDYRPEAGTENLAGIMIVSHDAYHLADHLTALGSEVINMADIRCHIVGSRFGRGKSLHG